MKSTNPATGEITASYDRHGESAVDAALDGAMKAQREWRDADWDRRAALMRRAGELLRERRDDCAKLMANEMGKPVSGGRAEIDKCAWVCDYYADTAREHLAPESIDTDASTSSVHFTPLGVVLAVMPWNYPFWQVFRFIAPTISAGNAGLLKHASNVSGCALEIESIMTDAVGDCWLRTDERYEIDDRRRG